jgi:hypothetical protein
LHITFSPMRHDDALTLERKGDALVVNGEVFDFAPLPEWGSLPASAIDCPWFAGPVQRVKGVLHMEMILPHGMPAPAKTLFPDAISVTKNGPITLPPATLGEPA